MLETWTPQLLRAFEEEVRDIYIAGHIRAPVHLSRGNEAQLIELFQQIRPVDWVFSTYRSHYHALLKGIPHKQVLDEIKAGHSIHLTFPTHRFFSSAIVGGCLPIALGTALGVKRRGRGRRRRVWCFIGDMANGTGAAGEAVNYAKYWDLPITFVIECNGMSTNTPTYEVWSAPHQHDPAAPMKQRERWANGSVIRYCYDREGWPHYGVGQWVDFQQSSVAAGGPERPDVMG